MLLKKQRKQKNLLWIPVFTCTKHTQQYNKRISQQITYVGPWAQPINYFHFQFITAIFSFVWCPARLARYACIIFYVFRVFATLNTWPTALILMIVHVASRTRLWTYRFWLILIIFPMQCLIAKIQTGWEKWGYTTSTEMNKPDAQLLN